MRILSKRIAALFAVAFVMSVSSDAFAIPSLQVYVPGGTYDAVTETWTTSASSFTVWVVASEPMTGVKITASIGDADPTDGSLNIGGTPYTSFSSGLHPVLPPHGIFPSNWVDHSVGDMTTMTANTIADFTTGYVDGVTPLNKSGQIMAFNIDVTGFEKVHFDAWGYTERGNFRKAPFSHDGETGGNPPVPEPATILLFSLGAGAVGLHRRRKARKALDA